MKNIIKLGNKGITVKQNHAVLGGVVLIAVLFYFAFNAGYSQTDTVGGFEVASEIQTKTNTNNEVNANPDKGDAKINIPVSELSQTVKKYGFEADGKTVKYLAVLGSDGRPRVAFDGCEVCGGEKGYIQKGTDVQCVNCGRVFKIDDLGSKNEGGGCWPAYLSFEIEDGKVMINPDDLNAGARLF